MLENAFRGSGCKLHYIIISKRVMVFCCRILRECRAIGGQAECLEDQLVADIFGLESRGLTTEGSSSSFFIMTT